MLPLIYLHYELLLYFVILLYLELKFISTHFIELTNLSYNNITTVTNYETKILKFYVIIIIVIINIAENYKMKIFHKLNIMQFK